MVRIRLIQEANEDEPLTAIVDITEEIPHQGVMVYSVWWVGYGDDIQQYCSTAWVNDQETLEEFDYEGEMDFESLYENIMIKRC